jgi:hypothetical protein
MSKDLAEEATQQTQQFQHIIPYIITGRHQLNEPMKVAR